MAGIYVVRDDETIDPQTVSHSLVSLRKACQTVLTVFTDARQGPTSPGSLRTRESRTVGPVGTMEASIAGWPAVTRPLEEEELCGEEEAASAARAGGGGSCCCCWGRRRRQLLLLLLLLLPRAESCRRRSLARSAPGPPSGVIRSPNFGGRIGRCDLQAGVPTSVGRRGLHLCCSCLEGEVVRAEHWEVRRSARVTVRRRAVRWREPSPALWWSCRESDGPGVLTRRAGGAVWLSGDHRGRTLSPCC